MGFFSPSSVGIELLTCLGSSMGVFLQESYLIPSKPPAQLQLVQADGSANGDADRSLSFRSQATLFARLNRLQGYRLSHHELPRLSQVALGFVRQSLSVSPKAQFPGCP